MSEQRSIYFLKKKSFNPEVHFFESSIVKICLNTSGETKPLVPQRLSPFSVTSLRSLMAVSKSARSTLLPFIKTFLAEKRKQNKINFFWLKLVFITETYQLKLILNSSFTALLKCTYDYLPCILSLGNLQS